MKEKKNVCDVTNCGLEDFIYEDSHIHIYPNAICVTVVPISEHEEKIKRCVRFRMPLFAKT